jgi:hypothetical protein
MLTYLLDFGGAGITSGVHFTGTERYRSSGSHTLGPNTVISVWYRRDDLTTNNQVITGSQYQVLSGSTYVSTQAWSVRAQDWGIDFISVTEGGGFGNSGVGIGWQQPVDLEWHHALFVLEAWSGAFPGTFRIRLYHDGANCGLYETGGPNTYGHANAVFDYLELGGVYGRNSGPVMVTEPFRGDLAQAWVGTNSTFSLRDYYSSGPVNLGSDGRSGATQTLPLPDIYDRMDYPFESTSVMWNMSTRATRLPTVSDASTGLFYAEKFSTQQHLASAWNYSPVTYNSTTGYGAWLSSQDFNRGEYLEYNSIAYDEAVTTTPNWWYRAVWTIPAGVYQFRIQGYAAASNMSGNVTIRMTNYPNNPYQQFQTLGTGTDIFTIALTGSGGSADSDTVDTTFDVTFTSTAHVRFGFDYVNGQPLTTSGGLDILVRKYNP